MNSKPTTIEEILKKKQVTRLFQPILDLNTNVLYGYEALSRGTVGGPLSAPLNLFESARKAGLLTRLERLCHRGAVRDFIQEKLPGKLFLNVSPDVLIGHERELEQNFKFLEDAGLGTHRVVIELTEHFPIQDFKALIDAVKLLQTLGFAVAIDDLGAGYSSLRLWSEIKPEYVKIDRHFIQGVDADPVKREFLNSIVQIARTVNSKVIAEGVETEGEYEVVAGLFIDLVQGYYLSPPREKPPHRIKSPERQPLATGNRSSAVCAGGLVSNHFALAPSTRVSEVERLFRNKVSLNSLAVVENARPVGMVYRKKLLAELSRPFGLDLYAEKSITALMDRTAVSVDEHTKIEQVSRIVTNRARLSLDDDFIVTENGRFKGIAQVIDLLRRITELQVKSARHSNPLTMLPGNVPIHDCINELLMEKKTFSACYVDIDHFKPFNDVYGYSRGDEALVLLADILQKHINAGEDFVGHIGGDDFVAVFTSPHWIDVIKTIINEFEIKSRELYSSEDQRAGGIRALDRFENPRFFPFLSLSIGAGTFSPGDGQDAEEIARIVSELKSRAKGQDGSCLNVYHMGYQNIKTPGLSA